MRVFTLRLLFVSFLLFAAATLLLMTGAAGARATVKAFIARQLNR